MSVGTAAPDVADTIVALASGMQCAQRGIVRLSGPQVFQVVRQCFVPDDLDELQLWGQGQVGSQVARRIPGRVTIGSPSSSCGWHERRTELPADCWLWPSTRSYTGQPSAEFHLIGLPYLLGRLLQQCVAAGARVAGPGEFTMRAFLAGRLDLLQAHAVLQVIEANSPEQLQRGLTQLAGGLSHPLHQLREDLIQLLAHLEAGLDFVEEDIEFISQQELLSAVERIQEQVGQILAQLRLRSETARRPQVVLVGPPNAGKSSLYNALAGEHAQAIVSPIRGTTRDYLTCAVRIGTCEVELVDTAGLDFTADSLQQTKHQVPGVQETSNSQAQELTTYELDIAGQTQTWSRLADSDLLVLCWDGQESWQGVRAWLQSLPKRPDLLIATKQDMIASSSASLLSDSVFELDIPLLHVSSKTGENLDLLHQTIERYIVERSKQTGADLLGYRAENELVQLQDALSDARRAVIGHEGEELVASELHRAIYCLGCLVGTIYTDDILDTIFSRFCIGK